MDEKLTEPDSLETEIENLLAGHSSPEGLKPRFIVGDTRSVGEEFKVELSLWQDPDQPRQRAITVRFPKDEAGRCVTDTYDLTARRYKSVRNPASSDWKATEVLGSREMLPEDEADARKWIEKYKVTLVEGEVADEGKKEEK